MKHFESDWSFIPIICFHVNVATGCLLWEHPADIKLKPGTHLDRWTHLSIYPSNCVLTNQPILLPTYICTCHIAYRSTFLTTNLPMYWWTYEMTYRRTYLPTYILSHWQHNQLLHFVGWGLNLWTLFLPAVSDPVRKIQSSFLPLTFDQVTRRTMVLILISPGVQLLYV